MSILKEFKDFAMRGNVIDLAVGVVIGAAFNKIVSSLIEDVITPLILKPALKAANLSKLEELVIPGTSVKYGLFLSATLNFIIVAFVLFMIIKGINAAKKRSDATAVPEPAPADPEETVLLREIRDLLKKK